SRDDTVGDPSAITLQWPHLLVGKSAAESDLRLLNIQDPARPVVLWRISPSISIGAVALGFGFAYVGGNRLQVYELASSELVDEIDSGYYSQLRIFRGRLYAWRS